MLNIEKAKEIINEYVEEYFDDSILKSDDSKGVKVVNFTEGRYDWGCTDSYYTRAQADKLKENQAPDFLGGGKLFDFCFEENGILYTFKARQQS